MQVETALQIGRQIGRVETLARSAHSRVDDLWRVLAMLNSEKQGGRRRSLPWVQIIAMGVTAGSSLLGIILPERAAGLIAAIARTMGG